MNSIQMWIKYAVCFALITVLFVRCEKDDTTSSGISGKLSLEITDAPIDDANVEGVFVTVAEVKVDGKTFEGFSGRKTIDLLAYQNGRTEALGIGELKAGSYSSLALVLDYEADENGASPGCYVLTTENVKHNLATSAVSTAELVIQSNDFEVNESQQTDVVIDFDLRKAVRYNNSGQSDYSFVAGNELETALRFVEKEEAGSIEGNCSDNVTNSDKIVVYAYKKGTFNRNSETSGEVQFKNAVTSTTVNAQGNYKLSFLQEGDYELVFVSYENEDQDEQLELNGVLELNSLLGINLNSVSVRAESQVTLNVSVTGLIP